MIPTMMRIIIIKIISMIPFMIIKLLILIKETIMAVNLNLKKLLGRSQILFLMMMRLFCIL